MPKQKLMAALAESRNALYAALRAVPESERRTPNVVDGYSVADLCGLISAWESRLLTVLQQISQGDEAKVEANAAGLAGAFYADALYDNASFNQVQVRKRQRWPWRELLNELVWTREETGWTLASMSEVDLFTRHAVETADRGIIQLCPADIVRQFIAQDQQRTAEITAWRQAHGDPAGNSS